MVKNRATYIRCNNVIIENFSHLEFDTKNNRIRIKIMFSYLIFLINLRNSAAFHNSHL